MFIVRVWYDVREAGHEFGSFEKREDAEKALIALASRQDVKSAQIEEKK